MAPSLRRRAPQAAMPPSWADLPEKCLLRVLGFLQDQDRCGLGASSSFAPPRANPVPSSLLVTQATCR